MFRYNQGRNQWKGGSTAESAETQKFDKFEGRIIQVDLSKINGETEAFDGRQWLHQCMKDQQPVGWNVLWQPDRNEDSDNPIALMQFASVDTALLLRTHITKTWLPDVVMKALKEPSFKKICVGYEGGELLCKKMFNSFNFSPVGVIDLEEVSKRKNVEGKGLKALAAVCDMTIRKEPRIARSNWASCEELTQEQVQYAAEEAYFAHHLHARLEARPDHVEDKEEDVNNFSQGALTIKEEWEGVIVRRVDGIWCTLCDQGPMTAALNVESHIGGKKHRLKFEVKSGNVKAPEPLDDGYVEKGIVVGDNLNGIPIGQYKCQLCDAGPFSSLKGVDEHLISKKHTKKGSSLEEHSPKQQDVAEVVDRFKDHLWNLPDYVVQEDNTLTCTLCSHLKPLHALENMRCHLGGAQHAGACRDKGHEEIIFVKEHNRLEYLHNGMAVARHGSTEPSKSSRSRRCRSTPSTGERGQAGHSYTASAAAPGDASSNDLPEGWTAYKDPNTNTVYYWHEGRQHHQYKKPLARLEPEPEVLHPALVAQPEPQPKLLHPAPKPLPDGWQQHEDPDTKSVYYYNVVGKFSQWEPPITALHESLPPGWLRIWDDEQASYYYADMVALTSQFEAPAPHLPKYWERRSDLTGRMYWACEELGFEFFEVEQGEAPGWVRMDDNHGRIFWSHLESGTRFFEPSK